MGRRILLGHEGAVAWMRRRLFGHAPESFLAGTRWGRCYADYADVARYFDQWADNRAPDSFFSRHYDHDAQGHYGAPGIVSNDVSARLPPNANVLDVGCGTGLAGARLVHSGHRVTGIDISTRMAQKALEKGYSSVRTLDVTADELPWRREFDACICVGLLGEWVRPDTLLPTLLGVLRADAVIGLTLERWNAAPEAVVALLQDAGFTVYRQETSVGFRRFMCSTIQYHYIVAERRAIAASPTSSAASG